MGQRLTVGLMCDDECKAVVYYHWSGYTIPGIATAGDICQNVDVESIVPDILRLVNGDADSDILNSYPGGMDRSELDYYKEHYPNEYDQYIKYDISRNNGIVSITESGMDNSLGISEMHIDVFLDTKTMDISQALWEEDLDDLDEDIDVDTLPVIDMEDIDLCDISPAKALYFIIELEKLALQGIYVFKNTRGTVLSMVA